MTQRPRLVLVVDQPQRDLAGVVLTAMELARRGITSHLVGTSDRSREILSLRPDLVLLHNLRRTQEPLIRSLFEAGIGVGLLDTEGGVWADPESYAELLLPDRQLLGQIAPLCAWSPVLSGFLTRSGLFRDGQSRVTGCPRFDFYDDALKSVLLSTKPRAGAPYVLINTNYTEGNPRFFSEEQAQREFTDIHGWSVDRARSYIENQKRGVSGMIELVRRLAADFGTTPIVVRPHPFELAQPYADALDGVSNVTVSDQGPIQQQLGGALAVIQRGCTTAIEAGLAGVPTFSPQWVPTVDYIASVESVSIPLARYEDLRSSVDALLGGGFAIPETIAENLRSVVADWFYRVDGLSYRRVADAVEEVLPRTRRVDEDLCKRFLHGIRRSERPSAGRLSRWLRYWMGLSPDWSFRRFRNASPPSWLQTDQYFGAEEVRILSDRIAATRGGGDFRASDLDVVPSSEAGVYRFGFQGHSVTISPSVDSPRTTPSGESLRQ